ncbi:MAG: acetolactate synthase large subunit, partial [Verrucomicrobiales bacterium]|nr:acetolactate synthase large subunit [Verrucomicrobiales bacterium]
MKGCEILVAALEREGVDSIFAYPGGASMELHQALTKSTQIRTYLPRHEQGGAFAAGGYGRATGKAGVCMATSGPGATNLVTGLADAWMDSVPLIALTGQVPQAMIGKGAFQETDFYGMTLGVVKHSYLITDIREIPRVVKEAFHIATTGRPGPVVIDFPKNIQQQTAQPVWPDSIDLPGYDACPKADDIELNEIIGLIEKAERPVLYCGGGVITGNASKELRAFVEATKIPVTTTIMGVGVFPETHKLSLRWLGMHGAAYANWAVSGELRKDAKGNTRKIADGADLLLAFGVRFDDRVTGKVEKFCEHGTIVHVDLDRSEHNKNRKVQLPIHSDVKYALGKLVKMVKARPIKARYKRWHQQIAEWKQRAPLRYKITGEEMSSDHIKAKLKGKEDQVILPQHAIAALYELTK